MKNKLLLLLAMAIALSAQTLMAQVPSYVPSNGLVGYWPFNGNANDESGNGNNGVKNQVVESADRFGNLKSSYYFDGVSSYIGVDKTSSIELFGNDFSISIWVNSQSITNYYGSNLISKSINTLILGTYDNGSSGLPNTKVKYGVGFDTYGKNYGIYPDILPKTGWNHVVCVKTSIGYDYYINNQKYTLPYNKMNVSQSDINSALFFGKRNGGGIGANFNGYLDDIAIYNRALTQQEITTMYNSVEVPTYSDTCNAVSGSLTQGLVGYWPFCGNANDDSGNGNNGTVNGATLTTDRFGNANSAYLFTNNGIVQNIQTNYAGVLGQNNRTISLWYKQDVISTTDQQVLCGYAGVTTATSFAPTTLSGRIGLDVNNTYRHYSLSISNEWNHAVFVYETGNSISSVKVYLNGVLQTTAALTFGNQNTLLNTIAGTNFRINASNLQQMFIGSIDDIGIWNRPLSPTEVSQLYNQNQCFTNTTVTDTLIINVGQLSYNNPVTYANNITMAPNPASTQININFNNITDLNGGTLKVINSLGQEVATTPITTSGKQSIMQLATWGGAGLYFVQIINPQGQIVDIKKIILQ